VSRPAGCAGIQGKKCLNAAEKKHYMIHTNSKHYYCKRCWAEMARQRKLQERVE